jgi:hypothetical protein
MNYGKAVFSILSSITAVTNEVGNRIAPVRSFNDDQYPYLVYSITSNDPQPVKSKQTPVDIPTIQIDVFATSHEKAASISEDIRNGLDKFSGTVQGIEIADVVFEDSNTLFVDDQSVYQIANDYSFFIQRN